MSSKRPTGWPAAPAALPVGVVDNHTHLDGVLEFGREMAEAAAVNRSNAAAQVADGSETLGRTADGSGARGRAENGGKPAGRAGAAPSDQPTPTSLADHLALAASVGVTRMVHVACSVDSFGWAERALAADADAGRVLLGAVAIHPNEAVLHAKVLELGPDGIEPTIEDRHQPSLDDAMAMMEAVARSSDRIRAIGETGLDYFRSGERGRAVQREAFRAHIALAKDLDLPMQIHDRDAHDDVMNLLLRDGAPARTVFHCYSGDEVMAARCVERGWYLSFAGPVTFRPNDALRSAARLVPASLLQVETDAPYLTPDPLRGRANAPYLMPLTVARLAAERGESVATLAAQLSATAEAIYGQW